MAHMFDFSQDGHLQNARWMLQNAADGKTASEGGMNKEELTLALVALNGFLLQPAIMCLTSLRSTQLRHRLKVLLDTHVHLDGTLRVAADTTGEADMCVQWLCDANLHPAVSSEQFALFGAGNINPSDQMWVAENMPVSMVIHCCTLNPLTNCLHGWSATLEKINRIFDAVEFNIAGDNEMAATIGITSAEQDKLNSSTDFINAHNDLHVRNFCRFYISYAPTGRATCYLTGEKIPKDTLRISFAIIAGTRVIVKHGLADAMLAALNDA